MTFQLAFISVSDAAIANHGVGRGFITFMLEKLSTTIVACASLLLTVTYLYQYVHISSFIYPHVSPSLHLSLAVVKVSSICNLFEDLPKVSI